MKEYFITEEQMNGVLDACHEASEYANSWGMNDKVGYFDYLSFKLKGQAIMTEHERIDNELIERLVFELFKIGKYLDCLESTLDFYAAKDAKEVMDNLLKCRDNMSSMLKTKVK